MDGIPAVAEDLFDLLRAFIDREVKFLVVGGYALAVHGHPRATGDLDIWIECNEANAGRAHEALRAFGAPLQDLTVRDLATPGTAFQIGLPPIRIGILTQITGVEFEAAWPDRLGTEIDDLRATRIHRSGLTEHRGVLLSSV